MCNPPFGNTCQPVIGDSLPKKDRHPAAKPPIAAPLTHELALTLPHWRGLVQPIAARLAQLFRNATTGTNVRRPAPVKSPLVVTPRKASQPRPYAGKAWSTPRLETLSKAAASCELCSGPVLKRRRRHCDACIPKVRRAHGLRAIEAARKALAAQAAEGNDPRASDRAGRKRGAANIEQHRRNREWTRGATGATGADRDAAWFSREVLPKLDAFTLAEIAKASGLSLAACSRIRAGARVPHPRHWEALVALVGPWDPANNCAKQFRKDHSTD